LIYYRNVKIINGNVKFVYKYTFFEYFSSKTKIENYLELICKILLDNLHINKKLIYMLIILCVVSERIFI